MSKVHEVKQGEHMSSIASQYGFYDFKTIWDDPNNADIKKLRDNPNVLYPGDQIYIRDKKNKEIPRPTDQSHVFKVKPPKLKLHLMVENIYHQPVASAECSLQIDGKTIKIMTDSQGYIKQDLPLSATQAVLHIKNPETPFNDTQLTINIGHLDPVDQVSGQTARLNNLGYYAGPDQNATNEANQAMFQSAMEEFQCDQELLVDGICGPKTQDQLKKVHGC
ncbi:peptidoglycan-binding protein [Methylomonas sp. AM2-LC]|uniref:peptidoglycan-binding protein n=1 Tax=Methylomonas sp. AM2-LC TaxID=3153301 RepID=UPI0032662A20